MYSSLSKVGFIHFIFYSFYFAEGAIRIAEGEIIVINNSRSELL